MSALSTATRLNATLSVPDSPRNPLAYYRSKLFSSAASTNPLIASASPIFSLLERLNASQQLPAIHLLREGIEHELNAFHSKLARKHYAEEFIVIAQYLLAATIDEILGKNYLRVQGTPAEFQAFTPPSESKPEILFFDIVAHLKEKTGQYLDILELSYYCLITGFEGKHHVLADGRQRLDNLIDEIFQLIQTHRVHKPLQLFRHATEPLPPTSNTKNRMIFIWCMMGGLLITLGCVSHFIIEHKAQYLLNKTAVIA
jgi:type VI secretion system protein ImpK